MVLSPSCTVAPNPHAVLEVRLHSTERQRLPSPTGSSEPGAPQGTVGLLVCQGTLLPHIQLTASQKPQIPVRRAYLQP